MVAILSMMQIKLNCFISTGKPSIVGHSLRVCQLKLTHGAEEVQFLDRKSGKTIHHPHQLVTNIVVLDIEIRKGREVLICMVSKLLHIISQRQLIFLPLMALDFIIFFPHTKNLLQMTS